MNLSSYFKQWRSADEAARSEERRLYYAAVHLLEDGAKPSDQNCIFCRQLRRPPTSCFIRPRSFGCRLWAKSGSLSQVTLPLDPITGAFPRFLANDLPR